MAQYVFDPNDYPVGAGESDIPLIVPSGFYTCEIKSDSNGVHYLHLERDSFNFDPFVFSDVPESSNMELFFDNAEMLVASSSRFRGALAARISSDLGSYYSAGFSFNSLYEVSKRLNGSTTVIYDSGGPDLSTPRRQGARFRLHGSDLKVRVWLSSRYETDDDMRQTEPDDWSWEGEDSSIESGLAGFVFVGAGGSGQRVNRRLYWFSVGTDGDPAPTGPVETQPRRRASPLLWTPF